MRAALAAVAAATLLVGCGSGSNSALRPGDHIGSAKLVVGTEATGVTLFGRCNPVITKPGVYRRSCRLRKSDALFIGYGVSKPHLATLDAEWDRTTWAAWLDGHRIALRRFGTADIRAFMPARNAPLIRREWRIVLLDAEGRHRLRYRFSGPLAAPGGGVVDATFTFTLT